MCRLPKPVEHNDIMPSPNFEHAVFEAGEEDWAEVPEEVAHQFEDKEDTIQPYKEPLETVNLCTDENVKEVKIGALLSPQVKEQLISLLKEYVDVFAWSYQDMPGLDTDIVEHKLPLKPECPPVKQKLRRTHPDMAVKIK